MQTMGCLDSVPEVLLLGNKVSLSGQEPSYKTAEANEEEHWIFTSAIETETCVLFTYILRKQAEKGDHLKHNYFYMGTLSFLKGQVP